MSYSFFLAFLSLAPVFPSVASKIPGWRGVFRPLIVSGQLLSYWRMVTSGAGLIDITLTRGLGVHVGDGLACVDTESEIDVHHHLVTTYFKTILTNQSYSPTNITDEIDSVSRQFVKEFSSWMIRLSGYFRKRHV